MGAQHCPLGLHAPWGLRAAGVVGGRPRGGVACHRCEGRLVSGAVPLPAARPVGRAAMVPRPVCPGCGRCGRGDPAPAPQRAPLRAGVARCGNGRRASRGGGAFHHCEGRLRSGAVPPSTARPLGGLLGSATHVLWARVSGCGGPTLSPWPARPVVTQNRYSSLRATKWLFEGLGNRQASGAQAPQKGMRNPRASVRAEKRRDLHIPPVDYEM